MADLILDARIASLEASLEKVQNLLGWATRRQHCLEEMTKLLQENSLELQRCRTAIESYVRPQMTEAELSNRVSAELESAAKAIGDLNRITGKLKSGQQMLKPLSKIALQIKQGGAASDAQKHFNDRAAKLLDSLKRMNREASDVWRVYEGCMRAPAQRLLAEYSEFLAGLALRDSGFDEDICETADELLRCFCISEAHKLDFLTIPIPHESMTIPIMEILTAVIQLSYPEWTLWSLPIVAHEFWRAFARRQPEVRAWFQGSVLDVDDPQLCLGDAFAACSMGPAYAFYAFLLSWNPVNAFADTGVEPAPAKRALAIRLMLDRNDKQGNANPWTGDMRILRQSWDQTVAAANPGATGLSSETQDQITRAVSILANNLADTQLPFCATHWEHATKWASDLAQGKVEKIQVDPSDRMRDVLNAAWLARKNVSDANQIAEIAQAAAALRKRIPIVRGQVQSDFPDAA